METVRQAVRTRERQVATCRLSAFPMGARRFRRAPEPPAFRLTDDDVVIVRQLARYRILRSLALDTAGTIAS